MPDQNWSALAAAVKTRRDQLRLPQDLIDRGGPGEMTTRKIERAETSAIRNKTKTQLETALQWPVGYVDQVLTGDVDAPTSAVAGRRDWEALGREVRRRRGLLHLRQTDMERRGGPSAGTMRNLEQSARTSYAPRTFVQLDTALQWPDGTALAILEGRADARGAELPARRFESVVQAVANEDDQRALRIGRLVLALAREVADEDRAHWTVDGDPQLARQPLGQR